MTRLGPLPWPALTLRGWLVLLMCLLTTAVSGCSYGITVRRASGPDLLAAWRASAIESDELSPRTLQTLRRWDLDSTYQRSPAEAYAALHSQAVQNPQPELLFALAELCYVLARRDEKAGNAEAYCHYYLCAGYAYHYLFPHSGDPTTPDAQLEPLLCFDPRFRLACDLYNAALAKCIRAAQKAGQLDPRQKLHLPTADGKGFTLSVVHHGFAWRPDEFGPLLFCDDYRVVGLANLYRGYGLGVPLIGTRSTTAPRGPGAAFYPDEVSFPVTAFFRFKGSLADLGARRSGRLELYNPLTVQSVQVQGRTIPLETDLTTPLAYFLSRSDLLGIEYTGFLSADKVQDRSGIYMFEPYQRGKIPVLMVHGLLASPLTWTTMFNDLRADPVLRERYQFWFYLYPTANTFLTTAADLRQALGRLRGELDPNHDDPALDRMVLVAHSMGGLVSRLLTVDSGDDFWHLVTPQPFDAIKAHPDTLAELRRIFFFDRQPCVERVVFLATPHHGSWLSPSAPARLADRFVHLPSRLMAAAHDLAQENPELKRTIDEAHLPTSVDLLAPKSPALEVLAARTGRPGVHYHSIIGDIYHKGEDGSDGVVAYRSAHLDGVVSELVVPASHNEIHHHPRSVQEVRRILLEHLATSGDQHTTAARGLAGAD
jgi:pimeloyl-ACP methyl ester carboxylesterase